MTARHLRNISIAEFQSFLELAQCKFVGINGGHEKWTRADLRRPIIFQTHIDPIPEFIIQNILRIMGYNKKTYFEIMESRKRVLRKGNTFTLEVVN